MFKNHAMDQVVSRRPSTQEGQVRSQASTCVICDGQIDTGTGYPPGTFVVNCQYYSINPPLNSSS